MCGEESLRRKFGIKITGGGNENDGSVLTVPDKTGVIGVLFARHIAKKYKVDVAERGSGERWGFNGWRIWHHSH